MKIEKHLEKIANQVMELEKECQLGNNISENMDKMSEIMNGLSMDELIKINVYLEQKFS